MTTCHKCGYEDAYAEPCAYCREVVCPACSSRLTGVDGRLCTDPCSYIVETYTDATRPETVAGLEVSYDSPVGRAAAFVRRLLAGIGQMRGGQ